MGVCKELCLQYGELMVKYTALILQQKLLIFLFQGQIVIHLQFTSKCTNRVDIKRNCYMNKMLTLYYIKLFLVQNINPEGFLREFREFLRE